MSGRHTSLALVTPRPIAPDGRYVTLALGPSSPTVTINPSTLPSGAVGASYSATLSAFGGTSPYTYAITSGALPTGLTLSAGIVSGTPLVGGAYSVTIAATDATDVGDGGPYVGSIVYALTIVVLVPWRGIQSSIGLPWRQREALQHAIGLRWNAARPVSAGITVAWSMPAPISRAIVLPWSPTTAMNTPLTAPWGTPGAVSIDVGIGWADPPALSAAIILSWSRRSARQHIISARWRSPPPVQIGCTLPWGVSPAQHKSIAALWRSPPDRQRYLDLPWARGQAAPWRIVAPIDPPPPPPPPPLHDGRYISLRLSCRQQSNPDSRYISLPFGPWACYQGRRIRQAIIVYHTATLVRLPDLAPIATTDISIRGDLSAALWSMSASISSAASLDLLRTPDSGEPRRVRATLNGHAWEFLVERVNEGERFGANGRSIDCRSPTATLSRDYAPGDTYTQTSLRDASQIAADLLDGSDIALDWQCVDWLVPAGNWSYSDAAPIDALRALAEAVGAVVQSSLDGATLRVIPAYSVRPWQWAVTAPDLDLIDDYLVQRGTGSAQGRRHNYVEVRGETGAGLRGEVVITGTAGDLPLPQVTHRLITTVAAAEARGIYELSKVGPIGDVSLELPLFPSDTAPGLVLPGKLIRVSGSYKAKSTGVSIAARWTEGGLTIRQTVNLERHYDA